MTEAPLMGQCHWCNRSFGRASMTRHLRDCPRRGFEDPQPDADRVLTLLVEGRDRPEYWMYLEVRAGITLELLDDFLRHVWLECCGHLSAFKIGRMVYSSMPLEYGPNRPMHTTLLGDVLKKGKKASYEYDFGSTTHLALSVVDEVEGDLPGKSIVIAARNDMPVMPCEECGRPAAYVCPVCINDEAGWVCRLHAEDHECGEEMLLRVVNSPRVGTCGYQGVVEDTY